MQPLVAVAHSTSTMSDGATPLLPRFAVIATSSSGNTEIVAATTGKKIRVLAYNYVANGTANIKWHSGTSTVIGGLGYWVVNTGKVVPFCPVGWFETAAGEALNINLSQAVGVGGELAYVLV